ncbi:hypothetical protein [Microbacterium suaedae]|uniref:hypothetical protein n=1 Tax=Microbacterium suaedae TaxID=2067813 RepID=UPI000DA21652|nr:hypothetical protein [Microbacterium suaedae]
MDLRWLSAPEHEIAEAMQQYRLSSRPHWVPTKRQVLVHVNHCLMLWYLCIVLMVLGVRIDTLQDNRIEARDIRDIVVCAAVFAVWVVAAVWLRRWAARPPSSRARIRQWRQMLTAFANGLAYQPRRGAAFSSLITAERHAHCYPRFVAERIEFGNIGYRRGSRSGSWQYIAFRMPVPLPHMVLDSTENGGLARMLPVHVARHQTLSLEGDFDRWFQMYAPAGYGRDALFLLTPDVMAAMIDHAHAFSMEVVGDRVVFFRPGAADFSDPDPWNDVAEIAGGVMGPFLRNASRYRDDRVPEGNVSPIRETIRAALATPGGRWAESSPRIADDGTRLRLEDRRTGFWWMLGAIGWGAALVFLYVVPAVFAFAGFMSIADGR